LFYLKEIKNFIYLFLYKIRIEKLKKKQNSPIINIKKNNDIIECQFLGIFFLIIYVWSKASQQNLFIFLIIYAGSIASQQNLFIFFIIIFFLFKGQ
jgi:hypothetical protein